MNHKRIYRIMKENGLLLPRFTGRVDRPHHGEVRTLHSDTRWCSDVFEIRCWSGERVQVVFALDCCDREVIGWAATAQAVDGEMVRDLMAECLERRFGAGCAQAPRPLEWLSDNGAIYAGSRTRDFAKSIGLIPCTTPFYSPQSNGMAKAFVKTFKRDSVYLADLDDALSVMRQLGDWFEDYNEEHPHKGLGMRSPRAFRRAKPTG